MLYIECFTKLLSAFANEHNVIDIRMRGKAVLLNDYAKGIIQTNQYQISSFPYHAAGLKGGGQIIGIADSGKLH